jgi:hypothetical protein
MKIKGEFLAAILAAILCISGNLLAYSGGTGEPNNPYQIANVADFQQLTIDDPNWNKSFILTANIDLASLTFIQAPIAPDISTSSLFQGTEFTGVFDGDGHIISNLTITASEKEYVGLFGYVSSGSQIRNLGVENVNITGQNTVGGLVGVNCGTLTSCYATGSVSGRSCVGGLVGVNCGTLTSCYATGSVSGRSCVGGLVAYNYGTLTSCYATGSVSGNSSVGGLVGANYATLTSCYATGSVSGTGEDSGAVGGLVGANYATLTSCYATGSVSGNTCVGGLVAYNYGTLTSCYATGSVIGTGIPSLCIGGLVGWNYDSSINNCYSTGAVSGSSDSYYIGGLVGSNDSGGTLTACYATGSVIGNGAVGGLVGANYATLTSCYATGSVSGNSYVGGLVGENYDGMLTSCFWDIQTSGLTDGVGNLDPDPSGVMGLDTATMMMLSTFTSAGWDFSATDGDPADWMMLRPGEDYPRLAWQPVIAGDIAGLYGINFVDYAEIAAHWGQTGCPTGCENADINNDGTVDINDLKFLADNWLAGI